MVCQRKGRDARIGGGFFLRHGGNIKGPVAVHLNHQIGDMEVGAGAACHDHGGNACLLIQPFDPLDKRSDRFLFPADHLLHQFVPDHKIGGAGILVDEEQGGTGFQPLHHIGRLRGAAAGVLGGEGGGVPAVWQVIDKHGDIGFADASSVLRPQF